MDPISAVEARIGAIEARFGALAPPSTGASGGSGFASVLAAATAQVPGTPTTTATALGTAPALGGTPGWALATNPNVTTPANRMEPGQYPTLRAPAELAPYGNGRIPPAALQPIQPGSPHRLWAPAARAFATMTADAAAAGVQIGVTDSYRPLDAQERVAREKGLYRDGGLAAVPGTSNHGWGLAVDLDLDERGQGWMREHGWRYGFVEDVPREPWHWTYRPVGNGS